MTQVKIIISLWVFSDM